ncbi:Adenosine 5'-monophosphoramidase [Dispira simplex]|nr:Adenosine 5'-monophosphoramidase [Dispira simplex]
MSANCIFCKIVKGAIPSMKLVETELSYAFLDIGPIAKGHAVNHAEKMHELPDEYLRDILPVAKKIALASGAENYNILQNNGRIAHQEVPHVHFHYIPKPSALDKEGLGIGWPVQTVEKDELQKIYEEFKQKL